MRLNFNARYIYDEEASGKNNRLEQFFRLHILLSFWKTHRLFLLVYGMKVENGHFW